MSFAKLKSASLIAALIGAILFGIGWSTNDMPKEEIQKEFQAQKEKFGKIVPMHSSELHTDQNDHDTHLEQAEHQVHNRPWASLLMVAMLFFGLSAAVLFFYAIQNAAHAGWPIVVMRVMRCIASFIPYGALIMAIIVIASAYHLGGNHLYHWMDPTLVERGNPNYDLLTDAKSPFLNIPFWLIRIALYFIGCIFFMFKLKQVSDQLDESASIKDQTRLYNWSVGYIVFFALASAAWAWDFLMSIDHHWYSTIYIWYTMVSCLVSGVAFILLFANYMKSTGHLPKFNDNHQHDLAKYLFGFSLLWGYLWYDQYMLYWYGDIPEDVNYFLGRYKLYSGSYFWMLIPNILMPLLLLMSSSIKRNSKVVMFMATVVILGHLWDFYNIVMPGTVGGFHHLGLLVFGAVLLIGGIFMFVVTNSLSKTNMVPKGNAYLHESEIYEYPF